MDSHAISIGCEFARIAILLLFAGMLCRTREAFDAHTLRLMAGATVFALIAEASFYASSTVHGFTGALVHLSSLAAYCLVYRAVVVAWVRHRAGDVAERKQAEDAVFEAHQVFRTLVENSPDIIARYDLECRRTYVNPTYLEEAHIPSRELLATAPEERSPLPADSAAILQALLHRVLDNGVSEAVDVVWPKADGIDHWYNVYAYPECDRDGRVASVMTVSREITERKLSEQGHQQHLRFLESMDRVNRAIQGTSDLEKMVGELLDAALGIFACDRAWLAYLCEPESTSACVMAQRTRQGLPAIEALDHVMFEDADLLRAFHTVLDARGPVQFGSVPDSLQRPTMVDVYLAQSTIAVAVLPKVDRRYIFGLHQCSDPRVWTREEERLVQEIGRRLSDALTSFLMLRNLRESECKLREAQRIAHVGYWDRDQDAGLVSLSDETCRIFGMSPPGERSIRLHEWHDQWLQLIHPEDRHATGQALADALAGRGRYTAEYRVIRPDGEVRVVHSCAEVVLDGTGRPHRVIGAMQDVTETKETEMALSRLNEDLERRVRERTVELEETNAELARLNRVFVGRELRMIELKERIRALDEKQGGG